MVFKNGFLIVSELAPTQERVGLRTGTVREGEEAGEILMTELIGEEVVGEEILFLGVIAGM